MWQIENNEYRDFVVSRPHQGCDSGPETTSELTSGFIVQTPTGLWCGVYKSKYLFCY